MRFVSCRDDQGGLADDSACAHLPKPPASGVCSVVACGQWKVLEWTVVRDPPNLSLNPLFIHSFINASISYVFGTLVIRASLCLLCS